MFVSYMSWSTRFISLKVCVGFSIFDCLDFIEVYFCSTKRTDSLTLKHNSFQNLNKRKTTYSFAPRPQIYKLQQQIWTFSDICLSWSSPKEKPGEKLFKLRKSKFWVCHFFSIETFKYLTLFYLLTHLSLSLN